MAKKRASKQPNAIISSDMETVQTTDKTTTITSQPANTSRDNEHVPAATQLRVPFFDFITLATMEDIKNFLNIASTTLEGKNLETLWRRAHIEGYQNGRKSVLRDLEKKMGEKYEEGVERGMNLGREEGFTVASDGFRRAIEAKKAEEASKKANVSDFGTQTDLKTTTMSISTQTNPISASSTTHLSSGTQTSLLATTLNATTDIFAQKTPVNTQMGSHIITLSTSAPTTSRISPVTIGTHIETRTSQNLENGSPTRVATSQSLVLSGDRKNTKIGTTEATTSENSQNTTVSASPTSSVTFSESAMLPNAIEAFETRLKTVKFAQKPEKTKHISISTRTTPKTHVPSVNGDVNEAKEVYTSPPALNDAVLRPPTPSATARSQAPVVTEDEKNALLRAVCDSKPPTMSPVPTSVDSALETRSTSTKFMKKHQKTEKTVYFTPKPPDSPISMHFNWSDDVEKLPILSTAPTKCPRDISGLRSSTKNPFSSLRRRHRQPRNPHRFNDSWSRSNCRHTLSNSCYHIPASHVPDQPSQLHLTVSLDWDQDPRLSDLSNALKALGWFRK